MNLTWNFAVPKYVHHFCYIECLFYLIITRSSLTVIRELDCMKRRPRLFRRRTEVSEALEWIEDCMLKAKSWIHVQSCAEETRAVAPTPPATAPFSLFSEENGMFPVGSLQFSPHIASPTAEDHILEYALFFKRSNRNGQLVLLSDDLTMKIKAMAEVRPSQYQFHYPSCTWWIFAITLLTYAGFELWDSRRVSWELSQSIFWEISLEGQLSQGKDLVMWGWLCS